MKLIRFGDKDAERPGVLHNNHLLDVSDYFEDYNEDFFQNESLENLQHLLTTRVEILPKLHATTRLGSPVARPSKIVCIGLNYADHAKETGAALPAEPVIFMKSTTAITGPYDELIIPKDSKKTDWEVELAVVISKRASYLTEKNAMSYVAGYVLHNDVSERAFQMERGGTWDKGKGCDTFAPLGPYLVTKDEIRDPDNLNLWLTVNGRKMQQGCTANFIFKVPYLVSYVSHFMTLLPGDIISTGTPAGVGFGMQPQLYLKPGDEVELGIDGLGSSKQKVVAYAAD